MTAAAFKRAFERAANKEQGSPAIAFMHDVVGADARNEGRAGSVSGITASGQTLTIRLMRANPTFLAEIAMPFFAAVKPSMAIDSRGSASTRPPARTGSPAARSAARSCSSGTASTRATAPRTRTGS